LAINQIFEQFPSFQHPAKARKALPIFKIGSMAATHHSVGYPSQCLAGFQPGS
jgi:hypothetical protein